MESHVEWRAGYSGSGPKEKVFSRPQDRKQVRPRLYLPGFILPAVVAIAVWHALPEVYLLPARA